MHSCSSWTSLSFPFRATTSWYRQCRKLWNCRRRSSCGVVDVTVIILLVPAVQSYVSRAIQSDRVLDIPVMPTVQFLNKVVDMVLRQLLTVQTVQTSRLLSPTRSSTSLVRSAAGSARRRRERRLGSWWRHEQQSVRAARAAALHHSCDVGPGMNDAPQDRRLPGRRRNPSFSRCLRRSSGVRGLTVSPTSGRRNGSSGAPWISLLSPRLVCKLLMLLCRWWWNSWRTSSPLSMRRRGRRMRGWARWRT